MTKNELYRRVLERVQVAAEGEPAQPEDVQLVAERYRFVHELLVDRELSDWDPDSDIPDGAAPAVIMVVAAYSVEEFGIPEPRKTSLKVEGLLDLPQPSLAQRQLSKRKAKGYIPTRMRAEYF